MSETCSCGGRIGPDVTGRPMCYGCGPSEMAPRPERRCNCCGKTRAEWAPNTAHVISWSDPRDWWDGYDVDMKTLEALP